MMIQNKFEELYEKFILCWQKADKKKRLFIYIGVYTAVFLVTLLIAYSSFLLANKSFVWIHDGRNQNLPVLVYVGRSLRRIILDLLGGSLSVPLFDISLGSGSDVIGILNHIGGTDPLLLLSAFVPTRFSEYLYAFLAIFRVYLAGLSFSYLCFYFKKRKFHTLIGSVSYCFCGFALWEPLYVPFFVYPMQVLPLLIVGIDRILKKERSYVFTLTVFYVCLCGYYHLYMMSIMVFFYAAVRFFDLYKTNRCKEFLLALIRGTGAYLLGLALGAIVFLPAVGEFIQSSRIGHHSINPYHWRYQLSLLIGLIYPLWCNNIWYLTFAAIAVFALVILFFSKQRRTLKILLMTTFATLFTSVGGQIMNGFQYPSQRWCFGLALVIAYTIVEMMPEMLKFTRKHLVLYIIILATYAVASFILVSNRNLSSVIGGFLFLVITFLFLSMSMQETKVPDKEGGRATKTRWHYSEIMCLLLVVLNVGTNGRYMYSECKSVHEKWGYEIKRFQDNAIRELEPYLLKNPIGRCDSTSFALNAAMIWQIPDMYSYFSITNKNRIEFWQRMEIYKNNLSFLLYNTDQRTIANTLFSACYQLESSNARGYVPFGYSEVAQSKKGIIYKNDYALPWGYTYDKVISYEELDALNGLERQEAMLQAIALEQATEHTARENRVNYDAKRVPYTAKFRDCEYKNRSLTVKRPNATIDLNFAMPAGVEGYLRLHGFDINDSGLETFVFRVKCDNIQKWAQPTSRSHIHYDNRENYLVNLGYNKAERTSLTITFPRSGTFKLKDIELYALPFTNYPARVNALRAEPLKNIKWGTNELSGTVDLTKDKILCVSVPYSKGWSATVDGKEEKILRGNYMFMALPLKAGHHDIVFSYCPPGLKAGAVLTLLSWGILAAMLWRDRRKDGASSRQA